MLFNSLQFAIFGAIVLVVYWLTDPSRRNRVLLVASLVFYGLWIPSYLLLLLVDVGVNYALLRRMLRSERPRPYLITSVAFTLGVLGYFKYAAFAVETLAPILAPAPDLSASVREILLPLGISFYSFQIIGLVVDAYRGEFAEPPSLSRFTLFVTFFPQLIAGPILRARELLPQLEGGGQLSASRNRRGIWLLVVGLTKKVVLADFLLAPFVNEVFSHPGIGPASFHLVALYSFAFQIYFDFSGYTDMARGMALLLGFELPFNFQEPYLSRDPAEFWRRWHMTLSRWLRAYLDIPLGGNRRGTARTYFHLMMTMLLGGLWHGASWNFVVWGGVHGVMLAAHRLGVGKPRRPDRPMGGADWLRVVFLFQWVCLAWVFFRANSFADALVYLKTVAGGVGGGYLHDAWPLVETCTVVACCLLHVAERVVRARLEGIRGYLSARAWGSVAEGALLGAAVGLALTVGGTGGEFIYFQF